MNFMTSIQLGMKNHTNWRTPWFFSGVGWNHQPENMASIWIYYCFTNMLDNVPIEMPWKFWLGGFPSHGYDCHRTHFRQILQYQKKLLTYLRHIPWYRNILVPSYGWNWFMWEFIIIIWEFIVLLISHLIEL